MVGAYVVLRHGRMGADMAITLVTGATGLVGSHVARALLARGDNVRAVVPDHGSLDPIADIQAEVEMVVAGATDRGELRRALRGVDRLFHVSDATTLRTGWRDLYQANVVGTQIALGEALRAGVERVVYT